MPTTRPTAPSATDEWLLESGDPAVRYRTLIELLGRAENDPQVSAARRAIPSGPHIQALLGGLQADGTFGVQPYRKWTGGHWRLVSLADLRYPPGGEQLRALVDTELDWLLRLRPSWVEGRARHCASIEGNGIGACARLGYADDERVSRLVDRLIETQWPDGGWNCDRRTQATHSSFHESISPLWGLLEYRTATGERRVDDPIDRAIEMFLEARLFRSRHRQEALWPHFRRLRYPPYWHYDILFGLRVLTDAGAVHDPRAQEALDLIERARRPDGRWEVDGAWWRAVGGQRAAEVVDWGRGGPQEMVSLHALRVLRAAGRS